ncbi:sensor histidine kinase [Scytonema sp. NUACC26]|uniref:sensor histidine kinase n=1 Tax=Scytonema sp. NUACC26 TaxID=3140176 RepID=UPI0034DC3812
MSIHNSSKEIISRQVNSGTAVRGVKLQASYSKLALSQRIVMPFLLVFFSIMVLAIINFAYWFSSSLEQQISSHLETSTLAVLQAIHKEKQFLQSWTKLIAEREDVRTAIKQADTQALRNLLVSEKTILNLDLLKVVNQNGEALLNLKQPALDESFLEDRKSISLALSGLFPSDVVYVSQQEGQIKSVLVGLAPIRDKEEIIGAIELGTVIKQQLFQHADPMKGEHIVAFNTTKLSVSDKVSFSCVYASTIPPACKTHWQPPPVTDAPQRSVIAGEDYLAKSVAIADLSNTSLTITVLKSLSPLNKTLQFLWLRLWVFFILGALITIFVGKRIARRISDPLLVVTQIAQKVTKESNFELQAPVTSQDEVGILAVSLNSLIRKVAEYTQQLEQARLTLERRVQERTQQLLHKNQELNLAYEQLSEALNELQQTQAQLIQKEKMSSLGNMVAGVAHEINNPINFIYGNIAYAKDYIGELQRLLLLYQKEYPQPTPAIQNLIEEIDFIFINEDLTKLMSSIKIGAQRIRDIILSLRNFSRLDEAEMKTVDIHEGLESTLLFVNHQFKDEIEVIKKYGNLPSIECYPAHLNQVFINILSNAIDALKELFIIKNSSLLQKEQRRIRRIEICTENVTFDDSVEGICIKIKDNGSGIEPKLQDKIFDPFFTTKEVGKGTGLGLWISYQIIQKHKGKIEVDSAWGEGTTFIITLPLVQFDNMLVVSG